MEESPQPPLQGEGENHEYNSQQLLQPEMQLLLR